MIGRWDSIEETLKDIGLPTNLVGVIVRCITGSEMQIQWNGSVMEAFKPTRGMRQGDPMSPYIFVLCMECLTQGICKKLNDGLWKPIILSRGCIGLTHLCFADDLLILLEASEEQAGHVKDVLDYFCKFLGLESAMRN